jgi:uncharacterized protein (TIGR02217 family)
MSGFHEIQFPPNISYGSSGGPGFNTNVITVDSGLEERVVRWDQGRAVYNVANGVKKQSDLAILIGFYRARMGAAYGFRYKDWSDYCTTTDGTTNGLTLVTNVDSTIATGDGTTTVFQLIKQYISGPVTRNRTITKPVTGTTKVALNGVNQASGWSVDTTTGLLTFSSAPGNGVVITAGFEFDVPVRFGEEVDKQLPVQLDDYRNGSVNVPMVEIIDGGQSSDEFFYGGAIEVASAANISMSGITRTWIINMTAASKRVILPATTGLAAGGPWFYIVNDGANAFDVYTNAGALLVTVAVGKTVEVVLSVDGSLIKVWYAN